MHCGCPAPIPQTGIRRLSRVVTRLRSRSTSGPTVDLTPPNHPDALSATHASEHNAFLFATNSRGFDSQARLARLEKLKVWQEHEDRSTKKDASSLSPDFRLSRRQSRKITTQRFLPLLRSGPSLVHHWVCALPLLLAVEVALELRDQRLLDRFMQPSNYSKILYCVTLTLPFVNKAAESVVGHTIT